MNVERTGGGDVRDGGKDVGGRDLHASTVNLQGCGPLHLRSSETQPSLCPRQGCPPTQLTIQKYIIFMYLYI